jgi:hypothetical protein
VKNSDVKIKGQIKMADEIDSDSMSDDFMQLFADSGDEDEFEGWESGDIFQLFVFNALCSMQISLFSNYSPHFSFKQYIEEINRFWIVWQFNI